MYTNSHMREKYCRVDHRHLQELRTMSVTKTQFWQSLRQPFLTGFWQGFDRMLAPVRWLLRKP